MAQEGASFNLPAKGRVSKPKIYEPKSQPKLCNRFKCFEGKNPENGDTLGETGRESPHIGFGGNIPTNDDTLKKIGRKSPLPSPRSFPVEFDQGERTHAKTLQKLLQI